MYILPTQTRTVTCYIIDPAVLTTTKIWSWVPEGLSGKSDPGHNQPYPISQHSSHPYPCYPCLIALPFREEVNTTNLAAVTRLQAESGHEPTQGSILWPHGSIERVDLDAANASASLVPVKVDLSRNVCQYNAGEIALLHPAQDQDARSNTWFQMNRS
jgi:hypothetical protein